jgi:hypothetical protein
MQRNIISGKISVPKERKQKELHRKIGEFMQWMKLEKDASEIRKDKRKSVPIRQLPMIF